MAGTGAAGGCSSISDELDLEFTEDPPAISAYDTEALLVLDEPLGGGMPFVEVVEGTAGVVNDFDFRESGDIEEVLLEEVLAPGFEEDEVLAGMPEDLLPWRFSALFDGSAAGGAGLAPLAMDISRLLLGSFFSS
jgi:hypothetical protein